ncbi:MAG: hypothetical protein ACKOCX_10265, partial [Planctomycetota bacterium]
MNIFQRLVARVPFVVLAASATLLLVGGAAAADPAPGASDAFDPLADLAAELGEPVTIAAVIEPGADGKPDMLAVTATLEEGWHLYSITQKPGGPLATKLTVAADSPRQAAGSFTADPAPTVRLVDDVPAWKGLPIEEHGKRVTWRAPLAAGSGEVRGSVRLQLCQDTSCLPPRTITFVAAGGGATDDAVADASATHRAERSHVTLEARMGEAVQVEGRQAWPLSIRLIPDEGWHLYRPASSDKTEIGQGKPTIVAVETGAEAVLAVRATEATAATEPELAEAGAVEGPVALEVLVAAAAAEPLDLLLGFQTCSDTTCDPPTAARLAVDPPADGEPGFLEFSDAKYGAAAKSPARLELVAASAPVATATEKAAALAPAAVGETPPAPAAGLSLPVALLMGLAGGLILNLMPGVLPVLGLKLMSFAQQSGRARREVFQLNLWYCAGLFAVFFLLATASVAANVGLGSVNLAWGEQFTW